MKPSEMTNEKLANELLETVGLDGPFCICERCSTVREAAARLRNVTVRTDNSAVIAELQRRLKVAEDAFRKLQERLVASIHDGTINPHEALKIAEDAIAAIREERDM